jgi:hypothetical protein
MTKYYIVIDGSQQGPFSLEELQAKKIASSTLVWNEDLDNWTEAKDIEELKPVLKKAPPPIPQPVVKPLKVEAEISNKREKLITPTIEVVVAKETKANFKMIYYGLIIGVISFLIHYVQQDGFAHHTVATKLKNNLNLFDYDYFTLPQDLRTKRSELESESNDLGYKSYMTVRTFGASRGEYSISSAISYHEKQYEEIATDSMAFSLIMAFFSSIVLILGRYIVKGVKWVEDTSKKEL